MSPIPVSAHSCFSCLSWLLQWNQDFFLPRHVLRWRSLVTPKTYRERQWHFSSVLSFTSSALNMRHCFLWEGVKRRHVFSPFSFAEFASWTRTHANLVQPFPAWKWARNHLFRSPFLCLVYRTWVDRIHISYSCISSIDMYNNDVGKESAQKFMKQTGVLKAATLFFAS